MLDIKYKALLTTNHFIGIKVYENGGETMRYRRIFLQICVYACPCLNNFVCFRVTQLFLWSNIKCTYQLLKEM